MKKILLIVSLSLAFTYLLASGLNTIYAEGDSTSTDVKQEVVTDVKSDVELSVPSLDDSSSTSDDSEEKKETTESTDDSAPSQTEEVENKDIIENESEIDSKSNFKIFSILSTPLSMTNSIVTPIDMKGWVATSNDGAAYKFINESGTPIGTGALNISTANNNDSRIRLTKIVDVKLSDVGPISYSTKLINGPAGSANASFRLNIDNDGDGVGDQWVVYETYFNFDSTNSTNANSWQTWNVLNGKFWGAWGSGYGTNKILSEIPGLTADSRIVGISVGMGNWNPQWSALVDKIIFNDTEYDFEPAQINVCSTTNTVNTTNLSTWNLSETRATGHNELTNNGLHVWTESNSNTGPNGNGGTWNTDKAAGYYSTDFALKDLGTNNIADTISYINNGTGSASPSSQLVVDFDNDGTVDGILVGETIYGNNWWLPSDYSSSQFVKAGAPHTGGGNGSNWFGTAEEWLNAFPNAKVKAVGYSLGSGVKGDFNITKITAGCVNYTFGLAIPTVVYPENNQVINTNDFWFDWTDVSGAVSYEGQFSQSSQTDLNGSLTESVWHGDYQKNEPVASTAHSVGANGTWYWQVRTVDSQGNKGPWSPVWKMTIDTIAPSAPTNLSWTTAKGNVIANGGTTKEVSGTASWDASVSSDVDHYIYKYWNAIDGNQYKVGSEYDPNVNGTSLGGTFDQGEGTHYYCVVAVDAAGNESECSDPFKITYTIDRTAPAAPIILAPTARQWFKSSPILNAWSEVTEDINGDDEEIDHYQVAYNYDDGHTFGGVNTCPGLVMIGADGFTGCRNVDGTSRSHQPADSEQGGVTVWVRAIDVDGNAGAWSKSVHYYFDKTSPATDINVSSVVDGKFTISGTATDNLALNRVYVQLVSRVTNDRCGGTTVNLITSPFSTSSLWSVDYDISTLTVTGTSTACVDGDFAAHVSVTDMAGNSSTAGWTENFMVTTPENNGGGDIENPAPTVLGNYFVAKAEELNVGFSVKNLTNNASSVKVSLYDADNNLITENIGNTQVMVDLLNTNPTEISSPFWIPTKANDEYWNFGTPDWKNANKPSYAIVTLTYNTGEEVASDKISFISPDELGNNWEALIASLPEDQNGIPTTLGPTGRAGGGLAFTTAYTTPSTTLPQQEGRVLGATAFQFTKDLKFGSVHDEVLALQKFLNLKGFTVATSGAGSLGNETRVFGPKTKAAVIKYQEANPVILTNVEILDGKGTGNFFWSTRGFVNDVLLNDSVTSAALEN